MVDADDRRQKRSIGWSKSLARQGVDCSILEFPHLPDAHHGPNRCMSLVSLPEQLEAATPGFQQGPKACVFRNFLRILTESCAGSSVLLALVCESKRVW